MNPIWMNRKLWFGTAIALFLLLFWLLGGVNSGLRYLKKQLASREIEIAQNLQIKLTEAEQKAKVNESKAKDLSSRIALKDRELSSVRVQLQDVKRRLQDAEQRMANINIPERIDDRVNRLRELGLKSATVASKPK